MQTQQIIPPACNNKYIDEQKIKHLLTQKLQNRISNPEEIIKDVDHHLIQKIQIAQQQISKQFQRLQKIKRVQEYQLKKRAELQQRLRMKIQKNARTKQAQEKKKMQKMMKKRKIKQELIDQRKKQIKDNEFKQRFERFLAIKKQIDQQYNLTQKNNQIQHKRSVSLSILKSNKIKQHLQKSKQIQEINYFKRMEKISKKKIYEKPEKRIRITHSLDKSQYIQRVNQHQRGKFIQILGIDLQKIQEARLKKQKQTKQKLQKIRKQLELEDQQRISRFQSLKQTNFEKLQLQKQKLNAKHERYMTIKNNRSTSQMKRSWSVQSSEGGRTSYYEKSSLAKTNLNFKISLGQQRAVEYLKRQKQVKKKNDAIKVMAQILKDAKLDILMK